MNISIFDLDNTLILIDSDYYWNNYLINIKIVNKKLYKKKNNNFYKKYKLKILNPIKYLKFTSNILLKLSYNKKKYLKKIFLLKIIKPIIIKKSLFLIKKHSNNKDFLIIITSTNKFISKNISNFLNIFNLYSVVLKYNINFTFNKKIFYLPSYGINKIIYIKKYLKKKILHYKKSFFYSDSYNDMPLLSIITNPIIVNPNYKFKKYIINKNWPLIYVK